jgi:DNA-binding XRE family transcriptional regulator
MLAVVRTPRINVRIAGRLPPRLLRCLKTEFGTKLKLTEDDDNQTVDFFKTDFYQEMKKEMTPGAYVRIYRENHEMSQEQLGQKVGASKSFICDIEKDRRAISKEMAKKLSGVFNISVSRFI